MDCETRVRISGGQLHASACIHGDEHQHQLVCSNWGLPTGLNSSVNVGYITSPCHNHRNYYIYCKMQKYKPINEYTIARDNWKKNKRLYSVPAAVSCLILATIMSCSMPCNEQHVDPHCKLQMWRHRHVTKRRTCSGWQTVPYRQLCK